MEGEIPVDMENEAWQKAPKRYVAMGGQITHKPRNFVNRIDDIWVRSLYNDKFIVYLLEWDDRTKSVAEGKLPWAPTQVNWTSRSRIRRPVRKGPSRPIKTSTRCTMMPSPSKLL